MPKPIDQLTVLDLHQYPIWTYATGSEDEDDETAVCPVPAPVVPIDPEHQIFHVACDLVLATGVQLIGFMSLCEGTWHDAEPIVVGDGDRYWPLGTAPGRRERPAVEALCGGPYHTLFPVRWRLRVLVAGETELRCGIYAADGSSL